MGNRNGPSAGNEQNLFRVFTHLKACERYERLTLQRAELPQNEHWEFGPCSVVGHLILKNASPRDLTSRAHLRLFSCSVE